MRTLVELAASPCWYVYYKLYDYRMSSILCSLIALTFVLAPLPNAIFSHCGNDDFTTDYEGSGPIDLGRFITATVVITGFALPLVLTHSEIIRPGACAMSIIGGSCVLFLLRL